MTEVTDDLFGRRPEDVFLEWLMLLPLEADIAEAAASEIAYLDRQPMRSASEARLRKLLNDAIAASLG